MPEMTKSSKTVGKGRSKARTVAKVVAEETRPVLYPDIQGDFYLGDEALTVAQAKEILGWETEAQYGERKLIEDPTLLKAALEYGSDYLLKDEEGNKIRCCNNNRNREFREADCRKYAQEMLNKRWADGRHGGKVTLSLHETLGGGVREFSEMTMNGEAIILSRFGTIVSGQHRLIAFVLASQLWKKQNKHWGKTWLEEPTIECLIVTGMSEDLRLLRTIDNVVTRTEADTIYTSDYFADVEDKKKRSYLCKMLAKATDLLWKRTGQSEINQWEKYQTHGASDDFRANHKRLVDCVLHVAEENAEYQISNLKLTSPGECAALMYLMAASFSDRNAYVNASPPSEKKVDFRHVVKETAEGKVTAWDKAVEFWSNVGGSHDVLKAVRDKLAELANGHFSASVTEKYGVLCKAWAVFVEGHKVKLSDLDLAYTPIDDEGKRKLNEVVGVGGIDLGQGHEEEEEKDDKKTKGKKPTKEPKLTPEQVEANKTALIKDKDAKRKQQAEELLRRREEARAKKAGESPKYAHPLAGSPTNGEAAKPTPGKRLTRKEVEAKQTADAAAADAAKASANDEREEAGKETTSDESE